MEVVAEEGCEAARDRRGEQGQRRAAVDIGRRGEEDHDRDGHAARKAVDAVGEVHGVDAADDDEGSKDHIDRRRDLEIEVPERDIEVAAEVAALFEHEQENDGHNELQQELLAGGEAEIALELDLDEVVGEADQTIAQGKAQDIQVRIVAVFHHALPAEADRAEEDGGDEHDAAHSRRTGLGIVPLRADLTDGLARVQRAQHGDNETAERKRQQKRDQRRAENNKKHCIHSGSLRDSLL